MIGLLIALAGAVLVVFSRLGLPWKLPGDILMQKKNLTIYFPVASILVLSVVLTLVLNLIARK